MPEQTIEDVALEIEIKYKTALSRHKISQKEMAEKVGTTLSYYSKIELGLRNPSYNFIEKFKATFEDACVDEIFFN